MFFMFKRVSNERILIFFETMEPNVTDSDILFKDYDVLCEKGVEKFYVIT